MNTFSFHFQTLYLPFVYVRSHLTFSAYYFPSSGSVIILKSYQLGQYWQMLFLGKLYYYINFCSKFFQYTVLIKSSRNCLLISNKHFGRCLVWKIKGRVNKLKNCEIWFPVYLLLILCLTTSFMFPLLELYIFPFSVWLNRHLLLNAWQSFLLA